MTEREKKFIASWNNKIENGAVKYFVRTTLFTCILSVVVILFYTWNNIPENKLLESLLPLSVLIFGLGIPLGLILSWTSWTKNNNKYKFLTKDNEDLTKTAKKKWFGNDRIWDIVISNLGAVFFVLFYTSIFLFDSGKPSFLKYSIVGVILSYFLAQLSYAFYRYRIDKLGDTKIFPAVFKYIFIAIILSTVFLWIIFFLNSN